MGVGRKRNQGTPQGLLYSYSFSSPTVVGSVDKEEGQILLSISPVESASVGSLEDCDWSM